MWSIELLRAASGICYAPGIVEPALEFLKLIVDLAQNALDGSQCRVTDGCGIENQIKSVQVSCNLNQLIDVFT